MEPKKRPLSQQLAPKEQVLPEACIPREVLTRKSTRHQPLPEKQLPQYQTLPKQPQQQFPPEEPVLPGEQIPRDELDDRDPLSKKAAESLASPKQPHEQISPRENLLSKKPDRGDEMEPELNGYRQLPDRQESPGRNGELPHDQLIPLEELPKEQRFSQGPTVVDDQPVLRRPRRRRTTHGSNAGYNSKASMCLGILLIVIGILEIALNVAGIVLQHMYRTSPAWNIVFFLAPGLWCSIFFILCGAFGVVSARQKVTWSIVTHLVAATLASVFACLLLAMCGWGIFRELSLDPQEVVSLVCLILMCLMAFGALVALPLAIAASVLCCLVFCRKSSG